MKEKFLLSSISKISSYIIYTIVFYFLILKLGVNLLGIWVFLNSVINLGFLFIEVGLDQVHYQYSGKKDFSNYFSTYFFLKILLIMLNVFMALIIITIIQLWTKIFLTLILFLLFSKVFTCATQIFIVNLNTKLKIIILEILSFIIILFKSILVIVLIFNYEFIKDPILYLCFSFFIIDLLGLILISIISMKDITYTKPNIELAYIYLKDQKNLIYSAIIFVVYANLGNLIIYYYFGEESLGYISLVIIFIIPSLLMISDSFISLYLTYFPKYFENDDISSIIKITYTVEKYISILYLTIIIIVFLIGDSIMISIFPKFEKSIVILQIMIFMPYLIGTTQSYAYTLVGGKKLKTNSFVNSITRIIAIFLMFLLIPDFFLFFQAFGLGIIGYALALTLPWILWFFLCRYYSNRYFNIKPQLRVFIHIPLALITFIISLVIKNILVPFISNQIHLIIILTIISIGIFLLLLILAKELNEKDLKFFIQLLKIENYKRSIKEELQR